MQWLFTPLELVFRNRLHAGKRQDRYVFLLHGPRPDPVGDLAALPMGLFHPEPTAVTKQVRDLLFLFSTAAYIDDMPGAGWSILMWTMNGR